MKGDIFLLTLRCLSVASPSIFPNASQWTQRMFNLGCLQEIESVMVNPDAELCVWMHASLDISTGRSVSFIFGD